MKSPMIEPASDCARHGERVSYDVEQAYRRGVQQGAHWACALIERGEHELDVRKWIDRTLWDWRFGLRRKRRKRDNTAIATPAPGIRKGTFM